MNPKRCLAALSALLFANGCGFQSPSGGATAASPTNAAHVNTSAAATPGPSAPSTGNITWAKYEDPLEQAFTLEVPKGWTVKGGLFRLGYSDHRVMVDITSPDGRVNVRVGDVAIPVYFLPNQNHHEGEVYDLGAQAQGTVARYRSGQEFVEVYGKMRFARVCQNLTPQQTTSAPPVKVEEPQSPGITTIQASNGQATYACTTSQGPRTAYAFTQTALFGNLWQVPNIASYVAPPAQVALARNVLEHASDTLQLSPAWIQKQNQLDKDALVYQRERQQARMRALSQQVAQFEMKMQAMQNQVTQFERGQAQRQSEFQKVDNIIAGVTPTIDPLGNEHEVMTGPKSGYYVNPATGEHVNADKSPGPGWQQLTIKQQ
jgi:hypothetical protein